MGYTTDFSGQFTIDRPVDQATYDLLYGLATTRRMGRKGLPKENGVEGEFYVDGSDNYGIDDNIIDYNTPPKTQPGLWCQWLIQEDKQTIEWDGGEKFYHYVEWIKYFINSILKPQKYILNGQVTWQGEDIGDRGLIIIKNNKVTVKDLR